MERGRCAGSTMIRRCTTVPNACPHMAHRIFSPTHTPRVMFSTAQWHDREGQDEGMHAATTVEVIEEASVVRTSVTDGEFSEVEASSATTVTMEVDVKKEALEGEVTTDQPRQPASAFLSAGLADLAKELENLVVDIRKAVKHALWFGDRSNSALYIRNSRSMPEEHKPVFRRTFLNSALESLPITRRTPPSVREREANAMRAMRAKEDVVNYKKTIEARLEDVQKPRSLAEWGGFAEAKIREEMENFKGSSINLLELVEQPEYNNPYLDSTTRIMYRMMKKNDCLPYWLQLDKDIKQAVEELRTELAEMKKRWKKDEEVARVRRRTLAAGLVSSEVSDALDAVRFEDSQAWKNPDTQQRLAKKVKKINGMILNFNLAAPHMNFQKFFLDLEQEVTSIEE